jgi:hypothetical protein
VLELFDTEDAARLNTQGSRRVFYRVLRGFDPTPCTKIFVSA